LASFSVWEGIRDSLGRIRSVFADNEEVAAGLKKFTLKLITPAVEKIGWDFKDGEDYLTIQLRKLLISMAGGAGHEGVLSEAKRRFELYTSGKDQTAIHPDLRRAVFRTVIGDGGKAEYEAVKNEYLTSTGIDTREICLASLGNVRDSALANDLLNFMMSSSVAIQDKHTPAASLSQNPKARLQLWHYIKENWSTIRAELGGNMVVLDRFLRVALNHLASHEAEKDIASFFEGKDNTGYDRTLGVIADSVKGNANYKERDEKLVLEWLKAHGYA